MKLLIDSFYTVEDTTKSMLPVGAPDLLRSLARLLAARKFGKTSFATMFHIAYSQVVRYYFFPSQYARNRSPSNLPAVGLFPDSIRDAKKRTTRARRSLPLPSVSKTPSRPN